jgi:hypothetical protein
MMPDAFRLLLAGVLFTVAAAVSAVAAEKKAAKKEEGTPRAFLESIYKQYATPNSPGVRIGSRAQLDRYFTANLAADIDRDFAAAKRKNEVPTLNGDPFIDAQDWDIKNVRITVGQDTSAAAVGTVAFNNYGEERTVRLNLVRTAYGWRIDDIRWREGSLRGLYRKQ